MNLIYIRRPFLDPMPRRSKAKQLLEVEEVRQWFEDLARKNQTTADENLRVLARFLREAGFRPRQILEAQQDRPSRMEFVNAFREYIGQKLAAKRLPGYVKNFGKVLNSFLNFHGYPDLPKVRVGNTQATPTLRGAPFPTRDAVRRALFLATPRARVGTAFMAFAGVREKVLANRQGTDGLVLGDLPELQVENAGVEVLKSPMVVEVRSELSKLGHDYLTFLPDEGIGYLTDYLQSRLEGGEEMGPETPLYRVKAGFDHMKRRQGSPSYEGLFVQTPVVYKDIKKALGQRPYDLRRYAEDGLMLAERKAGISRDFRAFWMGRRGTISAEYAFHKGLQPERIEEMREDYRKAVPYLHTLILPPRPQVKERVVDSRVTSTPETFTLVAREIPPELENVGDVEKVRAYFHAAMQDPQIRATFAWDLIQDPRFKEAIRRALFED